MAHVAVTMSAVCCTLPMTVCWFAPPFHEVQLRLQFANQHSLHQHNFHRLFLRLHVSASQAAGPKFLCVCQDVRCICICSTICYALQTVCVLLCRMIWQMGLVLQEISRRQLLNPMPWNKKLQLQSDQMKQTVSLLPMCTIFTHQVTVLSFFCAV